jgi:hypothetical protein
MRSIKQMQYWLTWVSLESGTEQDYLKGLCGSIKDDIRKMSTTSWVKGQEADNPENVFYFHHAYFDIATARLPDLDKLCNHIEEQSKKPRYRIRRSPILQNLVKEWTNKGRRSKFKNLANEICSFSHPYITGMRYMAEILGGKVPQIWIAVCDNNDALLFFTETEQEAANRFKSLVPKKEVALSVKVLVKMMALRLEKLRQTIIDENNNIQQKLQNEAEATLGGKHTWIPVYFPNPKHRELIPLNNLDTIEAIMAYEPIFVDRLKGTGILEQIRNLIQREFYDESVLRDAWNLIVVKEIHNS